MAETPEGSVARTLLAILDQEIADQAAAKARTYALQREKTLHDLRRQGRTPEEAEAIIVAWEAGAKIEMESVKCWVCEGWGFVQTPGCMGSDNGRCPECHGHQTTMRFKMPEPQEPA